MQSLSSVKAGGAKDKDVNFSSISSMLIELGLLCMKLKWNERSGFNQMAFNKLLLNSS